MFMDGGRKPEPTQGEHPTHKGLKPDLKQLKIPTIQNYPVFINL